MHTIIQPNHTINTIQLDRMSDMRFVIFDRLLQHDAVTPGSSLVLPFTNIYVVGVEFDI